MKFLKTHPDLLALLERSKTAVASMTKEEQDAMFKAQRESVARAEASWPPAKYTWVNGVKVYASYADYLAD